MATLRFSPRRLLAASRVTITKRTQNQLDKVTQRHCVWLWRRPATGIHLAETPNMRGDNAIKYNSKREGYAALQHEE
jgi:hypothetical protein